MRIALVLNAGALITGLLPDCSDPEGTPVRATLDEGQVLVGAVHTGRLRLEGGLGALDIPLVDVGEVEPVEGNDLAGSGDHVRVWLRNGTELVGRWAEPSLSVDVAIGGDLATVELPMDDVGRLQLRGRTHWPEDGLFRVRTSFGDDVFVDAGATTLPLETRLGTFSPRLSECASIAPMGPGDGRWRVELRTGTVLVGTIATDDLDLALPQGPDRIQVPLAEVLAMHRADMGPAPSAFASGSGWYEAAPLRSRKQR